MCRTGNADTPWVRHRLQSRRDTESVAQQIARFYHSVAGVDTDTKIGLQVSQAYEEAGVTGPTAPPGARPPASLILRNTSSRSQMFISAEPLSTPVYPHCWANFLRAPRLLSMFHSFIRSTTDSRQFISMGDAFARSSITA